MSAPIAAPTYFANMPASVPMMPQPAQVPIVPVAQLQNRQIGAKIKAAVFVAVVAVVLTSTPGQRIVRFVVGESAVEGAADGFLVKSTLATWAAMVVATLILTREL